MQIEITFNWSESNRYKYSLLGLEIASNNERIKEFELTNLMQPGVCWSFELSWTLGECIQQESPVETFYCLNSNHKSCSSCAPIQVSAAHWSPMPLHRTMNLQSNQRRQSMSLLWNFHKRPQRGIYSSRSSLLHLSLPSRLRSTGSSIFSSLDSSDMPLPNSRCSWTLSPEFHPQKTCTVPETHIITTMMVLKLEGQTKEDTFTSWFEVAGTILTYIICWGFQSTE